MLYNILIGIAAYILIFNLNNKSGKYVDEVNEYGLVNPGAMSKIYFCNILLVFVIGGYSYYVFTHQEGWPMYTMLGLNTVALLISYIIKNSDKAAVNEEAD